MGLTTALYTSLSGMNANSQAITIVGNNIANVNTTAFKSSRASFETQIAQTASSGSGPSDDRGGTNPLQIGLGTRIGSVSRDFTDGSLQPTGVSTDLAIEGSGFFILDDSGSTRYTRAGSFTLDRDFNLVSPGGGRLQGYGVDADFNVLEGIVGNIAIPKGTLTLAQATKNVRFAGNLNADGEIGTVGTTIESDALYTDDAATTPALATDLLTSLFDEQGKVLFAAGDILKFNGLEKGGAVLPVHTFEVGASVTGESEISGQTIEDLLNFMQDIFGIDTDVSGGITLDANGKIQILGNSGTANNLEIQGSNVIVNQETNPSLPLNFTKINDAVGESLRTTFLAYDSLGAPLNIDLNVVLEAKTNTGTQWRFYVQSEDDTDLDRVLGSGTAEFDTNGQLINVANNKVTIDRNGLGAFSPQQITIEFGAGNDGSVSALASTRSEISAVVQDGSPVGTLEDFSVTAEGNIVGVFSNSLLRDLGKVTLAQFSNPQGLEEVGGNLFRPTINSGIAAVVVPGAGGSGNIVGGALELSNVELSQEFIGLINASTGFTANSRVLTTSDRLIQELLAILQ